MLRLVTLDGEPVVDGHLDGLDMCDAAGVERVEHVQVDSVQLGGTGLDVVALDVVVLDIERVEHTAGIDGAPRGLRLRRRPSGRGPR